MPAPQETYSHGHHGSVLRSHRWRTADNSAAYLLPRLRPQDRVLDLGCGPGSITLDLASRLASGWVTGLDRAPAAVEAARQAAENQAATRVGFVVGDVYDLPWPDDAWDVVHAHQVLQHLGDPVRALRSMARVCRPGGLVAARDADYAAMAWYPEHPGLSRWLVLYRDLARRNGGEPDAGRRLRSWALAARLPRASCTASVWCFADPDDVAWWSDTWADRVTQSSFARLAVERGLADEGELAELGRSWREWGAAPDAWFSIVHGEIVIEV
jgi:ubiquinone/menaquinone biosynthesis C-methylase UbiE